MRAITVGGLSWRSNIIQHFYLIIQDCLTNSILWDLSRFVLVNKVETKEREGEKVSAYKKRERKVRKF